MLQHADPHSDCAGGHYQSYYLVSIISLGLQLLSSGNTLNGLCLKRNNAIID